MNFFSKKRDDEDLIILDDEPELKISNNHRSPDALTAQEVLENNFTNQKPAENTSAMDSLKKRLAVAAEQAKSEEQKKEKQSLLDRCSPYFVDEEGKDALPPQKPLYKLQSVADILGSSADDDTLKRLSEKYGLEISKNKPQKSQQESEGESEIFEETLPVKENLRNVQSSIPLIISDIDPIISEQKADTPQNLSDTATITFTPVNDGEEDGPHISITTQTRPIDLTGELIKINEEIEELEDTQVKLNENEFDEYVPPKELTDSHKTGKLLRKLSIKKRNAFISSVVSVFITLLLGFGCLPFMTELFLSATVAAMLICTVLTIVSVLFNLSMFSSIPKLFSRASLPDGNLAIASIITIIYAVLGIAKGEIVFYMLLLLNICLSVRSIAHFWSASYFLSNYKVISTGSPKNAVKLISDAAITFAMAKDSIEGDALIAVPCKTKQVDGYIKYSTFSNFFGGKYRIIVIASLIISLITGFACATFYNGIHYGFYAAAAIQCFAALPCVFLIDALPLYHTAKKLNKKGAMIAGKMGAEQLEMANAVVLDSIDLFPAGTITLHQMKILSENNLDDTLIRAASLTEYMGSTLAPIFKEIANSGNITALPNTDTVKYEDRMGISGWVDNRLLFIGNRTLMEAHGIEVPSVEVDRKILRQGYFPVYVSTREKACALLMIQYNVDPQVSHELRKLTALGVTLLINSTDPNLTEEMICDYLGLYSDSVKVMSAAGCHMYKNSVAPQNALLAPAAYKENRRPIASIINCANRIIKSNALLTVAYILSAVFGIILFTYSSLGGSGNLTSQSYLLAYGLLATIVSYLLYLFKKP